MPHRTSWSPEPNLAETKPNSILALSYEGVNASIVGDGGGPLPKLGTDVIGDAFLRRYQAGRRARHHGRTACFLLSQCTDGDGRQHGGAVPARKVNPGGGAVKRSARPRSGGARLTAAELARSAPRRTRPSTTCGGQREVEIASVVSEAQDSGGKPASPTSTVASSSTTRPWRCPPPRTRFRSATRSTSRAYLQRFKFLLLRPRLDPVTTFTAMEGSSYLDCTWNLQPNNKCGPQPAQPDVKDCNSLSTSPLGDSRSRRLLLASRR
jgi:hypothetical protein